MSDFINPDFFDSDQKIQFTVVLKNGERLTPDRLTVSQINAWLEGPEITHTSPDGIVTKFTPADIARVEA